MKYYIRQATARAKTLGYVNFRIYMYEDGDEFILGCSHKTEHEVMPDEQLTSYLVQAAKLLNQDLSV